MSFIPGLSPSCPVTKGLAWPAILLDWVVVSPLWSDDPASGVAKTMASLVCAVAAWRMASVVTAKEMLACTFCAPLVLLALSLFLAVAMRGAGCC